MVAFGIHLDAHSGIPSTLACDFDCLASIVALQCKLVEGAGKRSTEQGPASASRTLCLFKHSRHAQEALFNPHLKNQTRCGRPNFSNISTDVRHKANGESVVAHTSIHGLFPLPQPPVHVLLYPR